MPDRVLRVKVVGDERDYVRSLSKSSSATKAFQRDLTGTAGKIDSTFGRLRGGVGAGAAGLAGGLIASAAFDQLNAAIDVASNLEEQTNKNRVVFGSFSAEVERFAQTSAHAFGIANDEALAATGTFGNLFATVDVGQADAARMSVRLVQLAADLASFNNADPSDVLDAIRSGLIGEAEPLRRFGVLLSEARVQQQALADTGKDSTKALTDQEKVTARYQLILRDTAKAQGDFSRTSDGLANKQRILNAQWRDAQANIGKLVFPIKTQLVGVLADATEVASDLAAALGVLADIQIPEITIPIGFNVKIPGGRAGDIVSQVFKFANPVTGSFERTKFLVDQFKGLFGGDETSDAAAKTTKSAQQLQREEKDQADAFADVAQGVQKTLDLIGQATSGATQEAQRILKLAQQKAAAAAAAERAAEAAERQRRGFEALVDAISLRREKAAATSQLSDDLSEAERLERAILRQIKVEGRTTKLLRDLFNVRQEQERIQEQMEERRAARRQARQFRALGLTAEGDDVTPTVNRLKQQLAQLTEQLAGTPQDTDKLRARIQRIRRVLSGEFGKVTQETRAKIKELLDAIAGGLNDVAEGPLTKTSQLNTKKLLQGITGIDPAAERELRNRLSGFNTAGQELAGLTQATTTTTGAAAGQVVVESTTNLILDGVLIAKAITRQQQKARRRNPKQKRGPNRAGGV